MYIPGQLQIIEVALSVCYDEVFIIIPGIGKIGIIYSLMSKSYFWSE